MDIDTVISGMRKIALAGQPAPYRADIDSIGGIRLGGSQASPAVPAKPAPATAAAQPAAPAQPAAQPTATQGTWEDWQKSVMENVPAQFKDRAQKMFDTNNNDFDVWWDSMVKGAPKQFRDKLNCFYTPAGAQEQPQVPVSTPPQRPSSGIRRLAGVIGSGLLSGADASPYTRGLVAGAGAGLLQGAGKYISGRINRARNIFPK